MIRDADTMRIILYDMPPGEKQIITRGKHFLTMRGSARSWIVGLKIYDTHVVDETATEGGRVCCGVVTMSKKGWVADLTCSIYT